MSGSRVSCINPRCRRTWPREKCGGNEVICSKCFALQPALRARYRRLMKMVRHSKRYPQKWTPQKLDRLYDLFDANWEKLKKSFTDPAQPVGIEQFLDEMGLR